MDSQGKLYDSDDTFGTNGHVFDLSPNPDGSFTTTVLYTFLGGSDGFAPGELAIDDAGRIFGVTAAGGDVTCNPPSGCGTVFALLPPSKQGAPWTHHVLYNFEGGNQGAFPFEPLTLDAKHNVYGYAGTTITCGSPCGVIFELSPPAKLSDPWNETVLHVFPTGDNDGAYPNGHLSFDSRGSLYGSTVEGGNGPCIANGALVGCGTIFRLSPPSQKNNSVWTETILYEFQGSSDGLQPYGGVALDEQKSVLYGTTQGGGSKGRGTVFQLAP